ncbi:MAG: hypothetical protein ABR567_13395 [Myxococcales bacterium]|nr:hypothetical protein [Myxococcales bacterium]
MTIRDLIKRCDAALQAPIARVRSVPPKTWIKIGACAAVAGLAIAEIALRGDVAPVVHKRVAHARVVSDAPRAAPAARPAAVVVEERPSVDRLVAMTHAKTCAERSKAAEALASVHNHKAVAALKKLAGSKFKDESASPGLFSCSSRRAAQRALGQQKT